MKISKVVLTTLAALLLSGLQVRFALAEPVNINQYTQSVADKSGYQIQGVTDKSLAQSIGKVIKFALSLTGVIFLVLTVYAGFLWMLAGGNAEQVEKAQGIMKTAILGLIVIVGCYGIVVFILAAITAVTNTQNNSVGNVLPK
jgi:cytochrome bd-type quinol oxidase subunit 2